MTRILIILFFITNYCCGQDFKNGLIIPDFEKVDENDVCCVYIPKDGFNVYDSPNGQKIGVFIRLDDLKLDEQAPYKLFLYKEEQKVYIQFDLSNFQEVGYEVWALTFLDKNNGFVQVIDKKRNFWIDEKEITEKEFRTDTWQKFFHDNVGNLLGLYANDPGFNLRESPSPNSKIITTLKGDLFEITPTSENQGSWTRVKVKKYYEHPCRSNLTEKEIIESEYEGWIKIVDEEGQPNVWYYPRGC